ncbi:EAL domain-containing protein, partial [Salmonella enterica]|nr:EAL domain-containing protein [Salmonella enterica]
MQWLCSKEVHRDVSAFRLQQAIRNREFTPFYQPIVCATGGEVVGCEMLARWLHPQKGLL